MKRNLKRLAGVVPAIFLIAAVVLALTPSIANAAPKATVTVAKSGDGTGTVSGPGINCGSTCKATVSVGTSITLSAAPPSGSTFGGWSGPCSGTGSCTFKVSANTSVTATFNKATTATLTVLKAGTGSGLVDNADRSINCGSTCTATVRIGTTITLREYSAGDSVFGGWSGACNGSYCMVDVNADTTVTATFNKTPSAALTVVKAGDGTGTVTNYGFPMNCSGSTCTQTYTPPGSSVDLNAAAAPGSVFAGWSGGPCTGTGPCRFRSSGTPR